MFIKSTNEFISSPAHVWDSIEKHLGLEYAEEVKKILDVVPKGYTPDEEVEQIENSYRQELDSYTCDIEQRDTAFEDIQEICDTLIDTINNSGRLSRATIIKSIREIYRTAYSAH